MSLGLVGWLALGLHERPNSLHEEVGNGPWRLPDVDACDLSVTRIPGDRGDQCLGWIVGESEAIIPALPFLAWENDRFDEHSGILRASTPVGTGVRRPWRWHRDAARCAVSGDGMAGRGRCARHSPVLVDVSAAEALQLRRIGKGRESPFGPGAIGPEHDRTAST